MIGDMISDRSDTVYWQDVLRFSILAIE